MFALGSLTILNAHIRTSWRGKTDSECGASDGNGVDDLSTVMWVFLLEQRQLCCVGMRAESWSLKGD